MKGYDALLFDCDGVLIDSEPMGCAALTEAISRAGYPMTRTEATRLLSGNSARDTRAWLRAAGLDDMQVMAEHDRLLYAMFDAEVPPIPGAEALLAAFAVPKAVCSNSSLERLRRSLHRTPLAQHFGAQVLSAEQVARPKPAPDLALFAAGRLGVAPSRAVFIDDNTHGIGCARAAGCLAVGFIGPSEHRADHEATLRAAGAAHVVRGMAALEALLRSLSLPLAA